ncbi:hypothetical protein Tco_0069141, partial [Tanacetum coccineum]
VRMKALLEQQQLAVALEELPAAMVVTYDNVIQKKVSSALILCLGDRFLREITKKTTAMGIWKKKGYQSQKEQKQAKTDKK